MKRQLCVLALLTIILGACSDREAAKAPAEETHAARAAQVTHARLANADAEAGAWMSHGRTYSEQRFSPLDQINTGNVGQLGLAWSFDLNTVRGVEATPIVVDGTMYTTSDWSIVHALDARTGAHKWTYDPEVPKAWGAYACCDVVNRGVAVWQGKVYVGTLDGYLVALDAETGTELWKVNTIDRTKPYTITGAPRVIKGNVLIGNGGAEMGVRGYISAYNADTGEMTWRFYTVPGNPAEGFENETMKEAAETWNGEWWTHGGGGTVWDAIAYDPELDLVYIGVGNGSPWNQEIRSPGGGDNLFLSSIVALRPESGQYVWHYQTTPGETWDYTATQHIILADLEIAGQPRKVLMQAPKNGFFYVIDRTNGAFISANNYVPLDWATHVDPDTGRPVEVEGARYKTEPILNAPGPLGGHNWHPMSFSPQTGLVYIPAHEIPMTYGSDETFDVRETIWHLGISGKTAALPNSHAERASLKPLIRGHLAAWDPVRQQEAWRVQHKGAWNGGILSTAGNLVFQGTADSRFVAYTADTGEALWSFEAQTGIVAGPVSYEIEGEQYIAVSVGWGGAFALNAGYFVPDESRPRVNRVLVFKLGGDHTLPPLDWAPREWPEPPAQTASNETIQQGHTLFHTYCSWCHGDSAVGGAGVPDLRYSAMLDQDSWTQIVLEGALVEQGMISFAEMINADEAQAIRAYVIDRLIKDRANDLATNTPEPEPAE